MAEWVGWLATAVFVCWYFVRPSWLLAVQAAGAITWMAYGVMTGQPPVIVANVVVAGAAGYQYTPALTPAAPPQHDYPAPPERGGRQCRIVITRTVADASPSDVASTRMVPARPRVERTITSASPLNAAR